MHLLPLKNIQPASAARAMPATMSAICQGCRRYMEGVAQVCPAAEDEHSRLAIERLEAGLFGG